jgi:hypothetical protein
MNPPAPSDTLRRVALVPKSEAMTRSMRPSPVKSANFGVKLED